MNTIKTYVFDIQSYPYTLKIKATTILEAKHKVKAMGHTKAYFVRINL